MFQCVQLELDSLCQSWPWILDEPNELACVSHTWWRKGRTKDQLSYRITHACLFCCHASLLMKLPKVALLPVLKLLHSIKRFAPFFTLPWLFLPKYVFVRITITKTLYVVTHRLCTSGLKHGSKGGKMYTHLSIGTWFFLFAFRLRLAAANWDTMAAMIDYHDEMILLPPKLIVDPRCYQKRPSFWLRLECRQESFFWYYFFGFQRFKSVDDVTDGERPPS